MGENIQDKKQKQQKEQRETALQNKGQQGDSVSAQGQFFENSKKVHRYFVE